MKTLLLALAAMFTASQAQAFEVISLDQLMLDTRLYSKGGYNYMINGNGLANRTAGQAFDLHVNMTILKFGYVNAILHTLTDRVMHADGTTTPGQFRAVGLENSMGIDLRRVTPVLPVKLGIYHYSQHVLDAAPGVHYPVEDAVQLQVFIYEKGNN